MEKKKFQKRHSVFGKEGEREKRISRRINDRDEMIEQEAKTERQKEELLLKYWAAEQEEAKKRDEKIKIRYVQTSDAGLEKKKDPIRAGYRRQEHDVGIRERKSESSGSYPLLNALSTFALLALLPLNSDGLFSFSFSLLHSLSALLLLLLCAWRQMDNPTKTPLILFSVL